MFVDRRALTGESLVERDAVVRQPQQLGQPALAVLDRLAPDVLAVGRPVDDAGRDGQSLDRGVDEWETVGEVVALRPKRRTLRPRRCARMRKPSCLIS